MAPALRAFAPALWARQGARAGRGGAPHAQVHRENPLLQLVLSPETSAGSLQGLKFPAQRRFFAQTLSPLLCGRDARLASPGPLSHSSVLNRLRVSRGVRGTEGDPGGVLGDLLALSCPTGEGYMALEGPVGSGAEVLIKSPTTPLLMTLRSS